MHPKLLESTIAQCRAYLEAGDCHGEAPHSERLIAAVVQLADEAAGNVNLSSERRNSHRQGFMEGMSAATHRNLVALLGRGLTQIDAWQKAYGKHQPAWLPPAGDVRWAEDVQATLNGAYGVMGTVKEPDTVGDRAYYAHRIERTLDDSTEEFVPLHRTFLADAAKHLRVPADGVLGTVPPLTRQQAVEIAQEVGMLGDVVLNAPSLVRFAERARALGVLGTVKEQP